MKVATLVKNIYDMLLLYNFPLYDLLSKILNINTGWMKADIFSKRIIFNTVTTFIC